jgi:hypothetical protein
VRLVVYPRGGHFVPFTRPAMLAGDVLSFVRSTEQLAA